jgi:hypothetical protein
MFKLLSRKINEFKIMSVQVELASLLYLLIKIVLSTILKMISKSTLSSWMIRIERINDAVSHRTSYLLKNKEIKLMDIFMLVIAPFC